MTKRRKMLLGALAVPALTATLSAQTLLGTYEFTNNSLVPTDADTHDGITLSDFNVGTYTGKELFSDGASNKRNKSQGYLSLSRAEVKGTDTRKQLKAGRYLSFTITNDSGDHILFDQLEIDIANVNVPQNRYLNARVYNTASPTNVKGETITVIGKADDADQPIQLALLDGSAAKTGSKFAGKRLELPSGEAMTFYIPLVAEKGNETAKTEHMHFDNLAIYASPPEYASIPEPRLSSWWIALTAAATILVRRRVRTSSNL